MSGLASQVSNPLSYLASTSKVGNFETILAAKGDERLIFLPSFLVELYSFNRSIFSLYIFGSISNEYG